MKGPDTRTIILLLYKNGEMKASAVAEEMGTTTHAAAARLRAMARRGHVYETQAGTWRARTATEYIEFVQQKRRKTCSESCG